jgi:hypothetical protein
MSKVADQIRPTASTSSWTSPAHAPRPPPCLRPQTRPHAGHLGWPYPGSTGLTAMDYRLTDPYLDPARAHDESVYSETTIRLPDTFWCYDPCPRKPRHSRQAPSALAKRRHHLRLPEQFLQTNDGVLALGQRYSAKSKTRACCSGSDWQPPGFARSNASSRKESIPSRVEFVAFSASPKISAKPTTASTWAWTPFPTTATPPASIPSGWACPS